MNRIQILSLSALLALGLPALAQTAPASQTAPTPPPAPPRPPEPDPDPAVLKAMKSKVIEIKYSNAFWLSEALRPLGSGVRGASLRSTNEGGLHLITIRDFPENLAAIEEAIKRQDVPTAAPQAQDVELQVQVFFASKQAAAESNVPGELQGIIKSLKGSLAYRGYTLAASFIQRWDPSSGRQIEGKGQIDGTPLALGTAKEPSQLRLRWAASPNREQQRQAGAPLQVPKFQFEATEDYEYSDAKGSRSGTRTLAQMETSLTLREGEYVVVGTTMIKDHGLIVVLSARRVN